MDFGRALSFPFDDEDWIVKTIVGTLLSFIPFFAVGYQVRVIRNVMRGKTRPLPGLDDIGEVFVDGLMAIIAALIYFLPIILVACLFVVPAAISGSDTVIFCAFCCFAMLALLYTIPALALYWMGMIRYGETGNFSEYLRIGALWADVRNNFSDLFMLWLYTMGLCLLTALISPILGITVIGVPLLGFYYQVATGHLIGQTGLIIFEQA